MATKKKVVIVGAGYAGCSCAKALDKFAAKDIELILVSKRDGFFLNKYSAIRATVAHGKWSDRTLIPLSSLLKHGKLVINSVSSIDSVNKKVVMENGDTLPYDVLVIATGSRNFSPAEAPINISTQEETSKYYAEQSKDLKEAKSVVIVGSGPVGIELAGELKHFGQKNVQVSIVTKSAHVLQGKTPPTKGNIASVEKMLRDNQIDVYLKDEVASVPFPSDLTTASALVKTPNGVTLKSGKEIKCDLLVYTVGAVYNTRFVPSEWVDAQSKEVVVDEKTLLVKGTSNVFCVGDAAKINFTKLGYFATEDGKVVGSNVMDVVKGKAPSKSINRPPLMMVLPFGPHKGRLLLPFTTMGGWITSLAKGKGLFAKLQWSLIAPDKKPPAASV